ncbi:hypothetical protein Q764_02120 [Flavobacterium suncheonense GH29-5 = DSM 17707]|uniref:Uncharacterized protein n=1 Tax=Flavobacterium suncheonense GH29-5 = DSM 17707 TaxID=1121899 RepID=A0A0A2MQ16_9FLAO|nr:hypothetical protein Q764_02120 [Flavobacterium suncheonense GH29-5 = DSM 17707]
MFYFSHIFLLNHKVRKVFTKSTKIKTDFYSALMGAASSQRSGEIQRTAGTRFPKQPKRFAPENSVKNRIFAPWRQTDKKK